MISVDFARKYIIYAFYTVNRPKFAKKVENIGDSLTVEIAIFNYKNPPFQLESDALHRIPACYA